MRFGVFGASVFFFIAVSFREIELDRLGFRKIGLPQPCRVRSYAAGLREVAEIGVNRTPGGTNPPDLEASRSEHAAWLLFEDDFAHPSSRHRGRCLACSRAVIKISDKYFAYLYLWIRSHGAGTKSSKGASN